MAARCLAGKSTDLTLPRPGHTGIFSRIGEWAVGTFCRQSVASSRQHRSGDYAGLPGRPDPGTIAAPECDIFTRDLSALPYPQGCAGAGVDLAAWAW